MSHTAAAPRAGVLAWTARRSGGLVLVAILAVAAGNFLWQLGSSSYFVDEVIGIGVSGHPFGSLWHAIVQQEITPPAYFLFQHEWITRTGSQAEWVLRLPSALAGVALVAAVCWLASVLDPRRWVAAVAGLLAALSPLLLQYAQLAQGYEFAALFATVALAAALRAARASTLREATRWLLLSALGAAAGMCTNYTALLIVLPLCAWMWRQPDLAPNLRRRYAAFCGLVALALAPLFVAQWHAEPGRHGVGRAADLHLTNALRLLEAPFDGRADPLAPLGVAVLLLTLVALLMRWRALDGRVRLIVLIALGEPLALMALSAVGARVALTRYAVVAAPVMLVALALALSRMPRLAALAAGVLALVVSVTGLVQSHRATGFYADARGAIGFLVKHRRPGDPVLVPASPGVTVPLRYYAAGRRPPLPLLTEGQVGLGVLRASGRPLWVVSTLPSSSLTHGQLLALARNFTQFLGLRPVSVAVLPAHTSLAVSLWEPVPSGAR